MVNKLGDPKYNLVGMIDTTPARSSVSYLFDLVSSWESMSNRTNATLFGINN